MSTLFFKWLPSNLFFSKAEPFQRGKPFSRIWLRSPGEEDTFGREMGQKEVDQV